MADKNTTINNRLDKPGQGRGYFDQPIAFNTNNLDTISSGLDNKVLTVDNDGVLSLIAGGGTTISASYALSASYAATASFAQNFNPSATASYAVSASQAISASYAFRATSASFSDNANNAISASRAVSSSQTVSASYALSASFASIATSASQTVSASYALSSSYSVTSSYSITSSYAISASQAITSSFAISASNAISSSYAFRATSASFADNANTAISASQTVSASFAISASRAVSSSFSLTASYVNPLQQAVLITGSLSISGNVSPAFYMYRSGSTVMDIQGSQGQLFSIADSLSGSLMSVNDVSGLPILEVFSSDTVVMGTYGAPGLTVTGSIVRATGSFSGSFTGSLLGTASFASNTTSASYALSSSFAVSSSRAVSSSFASTASYVNTLNQNVIATGNIEAQVNLKSMYQAGDEGGEIFLNVPATNTTLSTGVTIDVNQDKVRIFENGGANRGYYLDISTAAPGVGTDLKPAGYTGIVNIIGNPPGQQFLNFTDGILISVT